MLISGTGRVVHANRLAAHLLDRQEGLKLEGGILTACQKSERGPLRALISRGAGCMAISKSHGRWSYAVEVVAGTPVDSCTVVIIRDPDPATSANSSEPLVDMYGLSRSEGRLLAELLRGRTLRESASALGLSWETSRTYLKRILEKTGTRRQAELVALALRTCPSK